MKKFFKGILTLLLISLVMFVGSNVKAASKSYAKISASSNEINVGETVTVNVTVFAGAWGVNINGGGLEAVGDGSGLSGQSSGGNISASKSYTFKGNSEGTYTVSLSGDITDWDTDENTDVKNSVTIKVNKKEEPKPDNNEENNNTEDNNNGNENNNTENNNNDNQNTEQPKPEEPTFTDANKTMYVKSDCSSLNVRKGPDSSYDKVSAVYKDNELTVIAIGSNGWYKIKTSSGVEGYVAGNYLTDDKPSSNQSSIATLNKLNVSPGNLNEEFDKDKFAYTMTVKDDVDTINVDATPTNNKANVSITGNTGLTTGTGNIINIKVVAEDGASSRTYKIKVTKLASEDENPNIIDEDDKKEELKFGLKSLTIKDLKITPEFKNDVYEYKATLTNASIEKLVVNAIATEEKAIVQITGADKIKDGENVITILVTSEDGEKTATYQITVKKEKAELPVAKTQTTNSNGNTKILLAAGAGIAILVIILIIVVIKKKDNDYNRISYQSGDYNEPDEDNEMYNNDLNNYSRNDENDENVENTDENEYDTQYEDDEDDDWGTPKRGFLKGFGKTGRHF